MCEATSSLSCVSEVVLCCSPSHSTASPSSPRVLCDRSRLLRQLLLPITDDRFPQQAAVSWHWTSLQGQEFHLERGSLPAATAYSRPSPRGRRVEPHSQNPIRST